MHVVHPPRVDSGQRAGQEISLLLVITLQNDLVPGLQERIERLGRLLSGNHARGERGGAGEAAGLVGPAGIPNTGLTVDQHGGILSHRCRAAFVRCRAAVVVKETRALSGAAAPRLPCGPAAGLHVLWQ